MGFLGVGLNRMGNGEKRWEKIVRKKELNLEGWVSGGGGGGKKRKKTNLLTCFHSQQLHPLMR